MKFDDKLMMFVKRDVEHGVIPMLLGEPGIGKSSWLTALATQEFRTACFVLPANQLADKSDVTGARLVPVEGRPGEYTQVFFPHQVITEAIQYALDNPRQTPILFIDEINRTGSDVTSELLSIPTLRAIGSKKLPDNLRVVIAGNDKGNVVSLDEASISRFSLYRVVPDTQTFLNIHQDLNPFVKNVLMTHPETIFCKKLASITVKSDDDDDEQEMSVEDIMEDGDDMNQITTPRSIHALSRWLNTFSKDELVALLSDTHQEEGVEISILQEGIEGHVGRTNFTAYLMDEIQKNVMTMSAQPTTIQIGKPQCYDALKACADLATLQSTIATLSDNDKSSAMLYALYEKADNTNIINALAPTVNSFTPNDLQSLLTLVNNHMLDKENCQVLFSGNTQLATNIGFLTALI